MNSRTRGFCAVIVSAVFFGLVPMLARIVCANGGNMISAAFYRFSLAVIPLFIYLKYAKIPLGITGKQFWKIVIITVFGYGGTALTLFLSYEYIPSGMATTIHFVYPVFVILGSILFLKERADRVKLLCITLCMAGILLFYDGHAQGSVLGILLAFVSGITYGFYIIYLDRCGLGDMPTLKLIFYMNIIGAALLLAGSLGAGQFTAAMNPAGWGAMLVLSLGTSFGAVCLFQKGVRLVGPQNASILSTFEPITSLLVGSLLFQEHLTIRTFVGCVFILAAVVLVARSKNSGDEAAQKDRPECKGQPE